MNSTSTTVLRYFACRGRAQPLRDFLYDANIEFQDEKIVFENFPNPWPDFRNDRSFSGPFSSLPVFEQGTFQLTETLAIASFLERTIGCTRTLRDDPQLDSSLDQNLDQNLDQKLAKLDMICSVCYLDIILRVGELVWSEELIPQQRIEEKISQQLPKILDKLRSVEELVPDSTKFFGGDIPSVADFFVFEAFDAIQYLLGPNNAMLTRNLKEIDSLSHRLLSRPRFAAMFTEGYRPSQMTSFPEEAAVIEKTRAIEWATVL